jgi:hypothetical protein
MNSLDKPTNTPAIFTEAFIEPNKLDGTAPSEHQRDPFAALDDLMTVVEALCPKWPDRDITRGTLWLL